MRVLFLGAGASISAGYPRTSHLLDAIQEDALQSVSDEIIQRWKRFDEFRDRARGSLKEVLYSSNPETVVSQLDLLLQARDDREWTWWQRLGKAWDERSMETFRREPHPYEDEPYELSDVRRAIQDLEDLIDHYFSRKHRYDYFSREHREDQDHGPITREYLRQELKTLKAGDVILTTNWDTLAERTLSELGLWYPTDGYGLEAPLQPHPLPRPDLRVTDLRSKVSVLKLHGSVGWHLLPRKRSWYLRHANFLQFLPVQTGGQEMFLKDPRESLRPYGWHESRVLIRPSYLKSLHSPVLQEIWQLAVEALHSADQVKIIGYSLPESDGAVRTLLNPLRSRLERGNVDVVVVNDDPKALDRWKDLLGDCAELRREKFGAPEPEA